MTTANDNANETADTALRRQLAAGQASLSEPVTGYGLLEGTTLADLIGNWRDKHGVLSDMDSHVGNVFCDVIEKQQTEISRLQAALEAEQAKSAGYRSKLVAAGQALIDVSELAGGAQGEWVAVEATYAPVWTTDFKEIESVVEAAYDGLGWKRGHGTAEQALAASERGIADDPFAADGNE